MGDRWGIIVLHGTTLMVVPNFHLLQIEPRGDKAFLLKHAPTETAPPHLQTAPTVLNRQFLALARSRQHICPHTGTSARRQHLRLLTRAARPTRAVPCQEETRYLFLEVRDGTGTCHVHWGAGLSPSPVRLYLEHTMTSLCLPRNYPYSLSLPTALQLSSIRDESLLALFYPPGASHLLSSELPARKGHKNAAYLNLRAPNRIALQGALLMTITIFIVAGLESAQQKGLMKNRIHHAWKLPGTLL